jgi:hypothetical protein
MVRCSATKPVWEPDIEAILDRARGLSIAEILRLAAHYRHATLPLDGEPVSTEGRLEQPLDRTRVISIAATRSGRRSLVHQLQTAAGEAIETAVVSEVDTHVLSRLGLLADAELAVGDAAIAMLLADRLSPQVAKALAGPWQDVT